MGTKNAPGTFDCYAALKPNEPYFLLRGVDADGVALVLLWAEWRAANGEDPAKVLEAQQCAVEMLWWWLRHKHPDLLWNRDSWHGRALAYSVRLGMHPKAALEAVVAATLEDRRAHEPEDYAEIKASAAGIEVP